MVTLTPVILTLRAGPNHHRHGDPYACAATVLIWRDTARIIGAAGRLTPDYLTEGAHLLATQYGVQVVEWERVHHGHQVVHRYRIDSTGRIKPLCEEDTL